MQKESVYKYLLFNLVRAKTIVVKYLSVLSGSFPRRQLIIANYRVKKFVRKSQLSKQTLLIGSYLLLMILENSSFWHFDSRFVLKTKVFVKVGLCLL